MTHRAQFTGVPWLRPHFLSLVHGMLSSVDPDPARLLGAVRRAVDEARATLRPDVALRPTSPALPTRQLFAASAAPPLRAPAVTAMLHLLAGIDIPEPS